MKHTQGPWKLENNAIYGNNGIITPFICSLEDDHLDSITKANAHLIAAAPDLLEALKNAMELLRKIRDIEQDAWDRIVTPEICSQWDDMKSAIAKAEGRERWKTK